MQLTQKATETLKVLPVITSTSSVALDEDIAAFVLSDLKDDTKAVINEVTVERARKLGGSRLQCRAVNFPHIPEKRHQCGGTRKKGEDLCQRHSISLAKIKYTSMRAEDKNAVK